MCNRKELTKVWTTARLSLVRMLFPTLLLSRFVSKRKLWGIGIQDITGLSLSEYNDGIMQIFYVCFVHPGIRNMRPIFLIYNRVLAQHHPEFLAKAFIVNAPWIFERIYHVVKQLVDPNTIE